MGAHAAPYMDADGTLHNLRPIGRLEVSGADPEPPRIGDTEFGGKWFTADPEVDEPAAGARPADERGGGKGAAARQAEVAAPEHEDAGSSAHEQRTDAAAAAHDPHRQAAATAHDPHGGAAPTAHNQHDQTAATAPDEHGDAAANARDQQHQQAGATTHERDQQTAATAHEQRSNDEVSGQAGGPGEHVVVDMDITGLLNGVAITGDPSITVHSSGVSQPLTRSGLDPAAVRAAVAERVAAVVSDGEAERPDQAGETEPERPTLSAADLEAIRWRLDGGTLREVVDDRDALRELGERLDGPLADEEDNVAKAGLLSVRAEVYRLLGELGMAAAASRLALAHAESAGDTQSMVIAQAELAHVLRLRGDHKEADRLFAKALGAAVPDTLRSVVHENAGRSCFDQGRHMEALDHFARAVRLGKQDDTELAERVGVCLEAVYIHVLRDGWGPYPREITDIVEPAKAAKAATATKAATAAKPVKQANPALNETTAEQRPTVERG
jgi:tetratricopeptide (TPR) repeat protein